MQYRAVRGFQLEIVKYQEYDFEMSYDYGAEQEYKQPKNTQYARHGKTDNTLLEPAQTEDQAFEDYLELRDEYIAREEQEFEDFLERRDQENERAEKIYIRWMDEKKQEEDPNMRAYRLAQAPEADRVSHVQLCMICISGPATTAVLCGGRPILCDVLESLLHIL